MADTTTPTPPVVDPSDIRKGARLVLADGTYVITSHWPNKSGINVRRNGTEPVEEFVLSVGLDRRWAYVRKQDPSTPLFRRSDLDSVVPLPDRTMEPVR